MAPNIGPRGAPVREPVNVRAIAIQAGAVTAALCAVGLVVLTTLGNLTARGIPIGFDFLSGRAGFTISESLISYSPNDSNLWAILAGVGNTVAASLLVIVISTVTGTLLGIARLSTNPLVSALARVWVETARNTPLLLLLLFIYTIWWSLPADSANQLVPGVYASMRGLAVPWFDAAWSPGTAVLLVALVIALLAVAATAATIVGRRTGRRPPYLRLAAGGAAIIVMLAFLATGGTLDRPRQVGTSLQGGATLTPETATLLLGLVFYTTGFIAEIVRSGINAVPRGQWEAARALGLSSGKILRLIILPQMMRVIVPPMTSQYINVVKNSTLALAIGYSDLMVVMGTVINKTSRAVEGTAIIIAAYLLINLTLSAMMNLYNRRVMIRER
ncbi:MAG: ABC transporter permease subunit [Qipengyuania sp.]|nr:ABC transporter permease subunit [Qipengyuania sp.]